MPEALTRCTSTERMRCTPETSAAESARLGLEPGQADLGWRVSKGMARLGLVWGLREPRDLVPRAGVRRVA